MIATVVLLECEGPKCDRFLYGQPGDTPEALADEAGWTLEPTLCVVHTEDHERGLPLRDESEYF